MNNKTTLWVLYLALVSTGMGQTVVFAVLPLLGRELNYNELQINVLTAGAALMYFLVSPRWGRLSETWGRKRIIIIGLLGYTGGTVLFNLVSYAGLMGAMTGWLLYSALVLSRGLLAGIMSATQPAAMAYMADHTGPEERTRGMSKLSAASGIGTMIGPSLTLFASSSLLLPLYLQAVITLLAAVLVGFSLRDSKPAEGQRRVVHKLSYFDPRYRNYLLVGLLMYTMMGVVQQTLAYYFQDLLQLDSASAARYYGFAMMISSGMMLFAQLVIVQRLGWRPKTLLRVGLPLVMVAYGLIALATGYWHLVVAMGFFGLGMGLASPGYTAGATLRVTAGEQGALAGLVAAAPGLGFVLGPLLGALAYGVDHRMPYVLAMAVFVPLVYFIWRYGVPKAGNGASVPKQNS